MNLFWLGEDKTVDDPQVDAETGNFYFWLGGQGDVEASLLTRPEFEQMLADMVNGKAY